MSKVGCFAAILSLAIAVKAAEAGKGMNPQPSFFMEHELFNYSAETEDTYVFGSAQVDRIDQSAITIDVEGFSFASEPGHDPQERTPYNQKIEISFYEGEYLYHNGEEMVKGVFHNDGQTLAFSGEIYLDLTASAPPDPIAQWLENREGERLEEYFRHVRYDQLVRSDGQWQIVQGMNKLPVSDHLSMIISIFRGLKHNEVKVRKYTYSQLERVAYRRANILTRGMINRHFNEYSEPDPELHKIVIRIRHKMIHGA